jgi:16S rRNA (guanine(1405)-N(7))-methyltransferase
MHEFKDTDIEAIVESIRSRPKYQAILPELIRQITLEEMGKRSGVKEVNKAVRSRLHQIGGAFLNEKINYAACLKLLRTTGGISDPIFQQISLRIMRLHASTAERIPILPDFYKRCLGHISPVRSVLDLACGLNPLAIPWMPLTNDATYHACDIFMDMLDFLNAFFSVSHINGYASGCNLTASTPTDPVQVAFLLKTLPLLEQTDKSIGKRIIDQIQAEHILITFPLKSLSGREKGMFQTYQQRFSELIDGSGYAVRSFEFSSELAYLVSK